MLTRQYRVRRGPDIGLAGGVKGAVDVAGRRGRIRHQLPRDLGALARDHDAAVPGGHQRAVQRGQDLFGPADSVGPHRRQRIGNAEDGQGHAAGASHARALNRVPVMGQPQRS